MGACGRRPCSIASRGLVAESKIVLDVRVSNSIPLCTRARREFDERVLTSRTNNSAALPVNGGVPLAGVVVSVGNVILSGDELKGDCGLSVSMSRKGFRDTGRAGASKGEVTPVGTLGDAARLRKGLFEERLSGWRPETDKQAC